MKIKNSSYIVLNLDCFNKIVDEGKWMLYEDSNLLIKLYLSIK